MANSKTCVFTSPLSQPHCVYNHSLANYSTSNFKTKIERAVQRLMIVIMIGFKINKRLCSWRLFWWTKCVRIKANQNDFWVGLQLESGFRRGCPHTFGNIVNMFYRFRNITTGFQLDFSYLSQIACVKVWTGSPALMQLKSRGVRSWMRRPWNSKGLAQYMAGTEVLVFSIQSTSHLILQSQRNEFPRRSLHWREK